MPKDVDEYVADNSKRIRDVDMRYIQVDSNRRRDLSFGSNFIDVTVGVAVYVRSTGDQMVVGHPDNSKGFGRGSFGDDKGDWSLVTDVEATAAFTKEGRRAVAEALNGESGAAVEGGVGGGSGDFTATDESMSFGQWSDEAGFGMGTFGEGGTDYTVETDTAASDPATTGDTELGHELSRSSIATASRSDNADTFPSIYASTDVAGTPEEFGIFDDGGDLLARVTVDVDDADVDPTDEIRGSITLTFNGSGNGLAVFTNDGEDAVAESILTPAASVGPTEFAYGDGDATFDKADSSLTSEQLRKAAGRDVGRDRVTAEARVLQSDMNALTVTELSEVGLFDNQGRMIWATTFRPIPDSTPGFDTDVTVVVS